MMEQLRLPKLFGQGCVLQQKAAIPIWGAGLPESFVNVSLINDEVNIQQKVKTDAAGNFRVELMEAPAGGPYCLQVSDDRDNRISVQPVYVGEVYVCGGQSNMELPMRRVRERYPEEFYNGGAPQVHLYKVKEYYDFKAPLQDHVEAEWTVCSSENLEEISAFSYFFGKQLQEHVNVPVGIINLSLGGTPVEAWTSEEGIEPWEKTKAIRAHYLDEQVCLMESRQHEEAEQNWQENIRNIEKKFQGDQWKRISLPGKLDTEPELKDFCGCIWLRKRFMVSGEHQGNRGWLRFGTMVDSDHIYINGQLVGETGYCYPPRRYEIPEGLLTAGENEILIRLVVRSGAGRFTEQKPYEIIWYDPVKQGNRLVWDESPSGEGIDEDKINLKGEWEYQIRAVTDPAPEQLFLNRVPAGLFHGMTAPCLPYRVRGVIWYQGESNDCEPDTYKERLAGMICDWRKKWQQEKLPFVIIQLPNCGVDTAGGESWPKIREAQRLAGKLDDVSVTVNIDLGEDCDLHPLKKKDVAARAVLAVRSMIYGENIVSRGPEVKVCKAEKNTVKLEFLTNDNYDHICWESPANDVMGVFEVAGTDSHFYPAEAILTANTIVLQTGMVKEPCQVRYAWKEAPGKHLIYNRSGLPASPFIIKEIDR